MPPRGSEIVPILDESLPLNPHPSPYYERLRLERITPRQAAYLGNIGGVDRPLDEVALGWGEDALVDVRLVGGT